MEAVNQGRRQKNFQGGGPTKMTRPKISSIKSPSTLLVPSMKIQGGRGPSLPPLATPMPEYQLLKSFGLTRPGNRTQVYRLLAQK